MYILIDNMGDEFKMKTLNKVQMESCTEAWHKGFLRLTVRLNLDNEEVKVYSYDGNEFVE